MGNPACKYTKGFKLFNLKPFKFMFLQVSDIKTKYDQRNYTTIYI